MNYTYQMSESKDKIDEQELLANQNFWNNVGGLSVVLEMPDRMVGVYRMISGEFFDKKGNSMCRVDFATNEEFHSVCGVSSIWQSIITCTRTKLKLIWRAGK